MLNQNDMHGLCYNRTGDIRLRVAEETGICDAASCRLKLTTIVILWHIGLE
jgi:hypothetical protein